MNHPIRKRSRLLGSCAAAALALALAMAPERAAAQGIQASGNVVFGSANISTTGPTETTVEVFSPTVVIDWTPSLDGSGNALDFIPTGSTGIFQIFDGPDFAVLNRILPSPNNNVAVINGSVISRIVFDVGPSITAGTVAFYSPTGLLIGSSATFDVARLLLTTLDTTPTSFDNFRLGGTLVLTGASGSTARIQINPGAQITASPDNSYFAVVAAEIAMSGTALVNGSHAYVVGEQVNLRYTNGLFDITVPLGTASSGTVMTVNGTVGGPASTGAAGDNHMIYGVARAQNDPISMLFSGNLGFDPAVSAGVINGEIILSANYDVAQRQVAGGTISDGINAVFRQKADPNAVRADVLLEDFTASSSLLAIGTNQVLARAAQTDASVAGNLLLVGRESAELTAVFGRDFTISGDVLVDARDYGVISSTLQSLDEIIGQGGSARILADAAGTVDIAGDALVTADGLGGADDLNLIAGLARGGSAVIGANDTGLVNINGDATVSARGVGVQNFAVTQGAEARGGIAQLFADAGGSVSIGQGLDVRADALAANGRLASPSSVSDGFGGRAAINLLGNDSAITVLGLASLNASARGGSANAAGAGSLGDAGEAVITIEGTGAINLGADTTILAEGIGGANAGGTGGLGLGGRASAATFIGGSIAFEGGFDARANGLGGAGQTGGDGFGGMAGANAIIGSIAIGTDASAFSQGVGGDASFGFGGDGGQGRGGNAFFQADGTASETALVTIAGNALVNASGIGGIGGPSNGVAIGAGRGGNGYGGQFTVPNQADPAFNSGVFLLAGGDNGTISIGGAAEATARGFGGTGGSGAGANTGGPGGDGFGGLAQVGLARLGGTGAIDNGSANLGNVLAQADGVGGTGGIGAGPAAPAGAGGHGEGGFAAFTLSAGQVGANSVAFSANGIGGSGASGGRGQGGTAAMFGGFGGEASITEALLEARGEGGAAEAGLGGEGRGGVAAIEGDGLEIGIVGIAGLIASARGGDASNGPAGNALGGEAYIATLSPDNGGGVTIGGHARIFANAIGGTSSGSFAAGNGTGGLAYVDALGGGSVTLSSAQVHAVGIGGTAEVHEGGNGSGGTARLSARGAGSRLTIQNNVPSAFVETAGGAAVVSANGIGQETVGGDGIGGEGRGGLLTISASDGGVLSLPASLTNGYFARSIGGSSVVQGGAGGAAFGGTIEVLADNASLDISGTISAFAEGGSSGDISLDITGGNAFGGSRSIRAINNATLTINPAGGAAGAEGGDGSGSGNGGNAYVGQNLFEVDQASATILRQLALFDQSAGGSGQQGGSVFRVNPFTNLAGSINLRLNDATLAGSAATVGAAQISLDFVTRGGAGVLRGGDAQGPIIDATINQTSVASDRLQLLINPILVGGNASDPGGIGGNAEGSPINVVISNSQFSLQGNTTYPIDPGSGSQIIVPGDILIASDARGGNGGINGSGGTATSGAVAVSIANAIVSAVGDPLGTPGVMRLRSQAIGGQGGEVGDATSGGAELLLNNAQLAAGEVLLDTRALASGPAGQIGGAASAGLGAITLATDSTLSADVIEIAASASTAAGGLAAAGTSVVELQDGAATSLAAQSLRLLADASGAAPGAAANRAGRFAVRASSGNANIGTLSASALGDVVGATPSELVASGGNINVSDALTGTTVGDLRIVTTDGAIVGSPASGGTTTAIALSARGTIETIGDGSATGGLSGQAVNLAAGGSILLGGRIGANNGPVSLFANNGTALPASPAVAAEITMSSDAAIAAGSGVVTVHMGDGGGVPGRLSGAITLSEISAGTIDVRNFGADPGSNINVLATGVLTASGTGRAIDLASLTGEVINLAGDAGLVLTGGGHFGVFAATPAGSQIGSFANYARRYNVADAAAYDAIDLGGNFAAFRIAPVLTVTANDASRFYGNANPAFTASYAGFQPGDSIADLLGAPALTTSADGTSPVGAYTINAAQGTLVSPQGYQFTFVNGTLTVTPRPITVSADNLSRFYGNANPALTFTVGGLGLVNGDTLTGALATVADATSPVGPYAITQGTLAASSNYALTFVNGTLTVTPRPITVSADNLSRIYGNSNPALTFTVGGQGLVNGDTLTGAPATVADATSPVGPYAITQGTLAASSNYALSFVNGTLTVTPRPITITAASLSKLLGLPDPLLTFTVGGLGLVNGDTLTGSLTRDPGEFQGTYTIRQGTLSAGPNYLTTFVPGTFTIEPLPTPGDVNSPISLFPAMGSEDALGPAIGAEEQFGMDFPEQPDAQLISEDPLLDEPVTSGGDPSLYGGGEAAPAGGQ